MPLYTLFGQQCRLNSKTGATPPVNWPAIADAESVHRDRIVPAARWTVTCSHRCPLQSMLITSSLQRTAGVLQSARYSSPEPANR